MKKFLLSISVIISLLPIISLSYIQSPRFVYISVPLSTTFFLVAYFISERNKKYGYIHYFLNCIFTGVSVFLSLTDNVIGNIGNTIGPILWLPSGVLLSLSSLFSVPYYLLERFRKTLPFKHQKNEELNLELVKSSFGNIKNRLEQIETDVSQETQKIDSAMHQLIGDIEKNNSVLRKTNEEHKRLTLEIEQLRALSSLSKEQADSIVAAINRGKYLDYFVGFILGIISSLLVDMLASFFKW